MSKEISLVILLILNVTFGKLIMQSPTSVIQPVSSEATFICRANSSFSNIMIAWTITTRGYSTLPYSVLLNGFGFNKTTNGTDSILTVQGYIENNGTTVQCTVSSGTNIEQSGVAQLLLYGPPDPVLNFTVTDISPMRLHLSWAPVYSSIPLNYSINITSSDGTVENIELNDTVMSYTFDSNQSNICQLLNFTIVAVNDAGKSESTEFTKAVSDRPGDIGKVTQMVFFVDALPHVNLSFPAPDVCEFYPITHYLVKFTDRTTNTSNITSMESLDDHMTLTLNQLEANGNYTVSITAVNEVGASNTYGNIEFVTSGLQTTDATLVGSELFVNCVFAVGSISTGCRVIAYNVNGHELVNETIERNATETAVNGSILITNITSNIYYVVVFDVNDVNGIIKWILIPTVVPVTTTVYISSTEDSSMLETSTFLFSSSPGATVDTMTDSPILSLTNIVIISASGVAFITIAVILFMACVISTRRCARRNKSISVQPSEESHPYVGIPILQAENGTLTRSTSDTLKSLQNSVTQPSTKSAENITISIYTDCERMEDSENNIVQPYGVTNLLKPDPLAPPHKEPLYQEVYEARTRTVLCSQSSTTPLLDSQQSNNVTLISPLTAAFNNNGEPLYHLLEEQQTQLNDIPPAVPIYDEVPKSLSDIDGIRTDTPSTQQSLSSATPTNTTPTPPKERIYHILDNNSTSVPKNDEIDGQLDTQHNDNGLTTEVYPYCNGSQFIDDEEYIYPFFDSVTFPAAQHSNSQQQCSLEDVFDEDYATVKAIHSQPITASGLCHQSYNVVGTRRQMSVPTARRYATPRTKSDWYNQQRQLDYLHKSASLPSSVRRGLIRRHSEPGDEVNAITTNGINSGLYDNLKHSQGTLRRTLV